MDYSKISISNKTDEKEDSTKTESETGKSNILRSQELVTSTESLETDARAFAATLQRIYEEGDEFPDGQQGKDKYGHLHQRTVQVNPVGKSGADQDTAKSDNSSAKKKKYLKSIVSKCQNAKTNAKGIIKRIKVIGRLGELRNEMTGKSKSPKIFGKKNIYNLQAGKVIETLKEKRKFQTDLQDFKDPMPRAVDSKNTKPRMAVLRKYVKNPSSMHKPQSPPATSAESKRMPNICSVRPISGPIIPYTSASALGSSKVKSAEEVLAHFRWHMQSNTESFDRIMAGDISEDMDTSESENRDLKDPAKATTKSASQDSKARSKAMRESAMTQESRKVTSEASATRGDNLTATSSSNAMQEIAEDESYYGARRWVLQQIKDREVVLKFTLMEGKYSDDAETKMRCIEKATNMQSQIDILFDTLHDHEKMDNLPKRFKGFWRSLAEKNSPRSPTQTVEDLLRSQMKSIQDLLLTSPTKGIGDLLRSPTKGIEYLEYPERRINTYLKLFKQLYNSMGSVAENENILKGINKRKLLYDYIRYLESKKKRNQESEKLKYTARSVVEEFYQSLEQCRSRVKSKIPRPNLITLEDYQNYISDLRIAVEENLECLYTIIPLATSVIFPLMSYLSQTRIKILDIFHFLEQERPHLLPGSSNKNQTFFDNFFLQNFKNR